MARKKRLGEILIDACLISPEQLEEALRLQKQQNRLIGQILVEMGWVSEYEVCKAVAELLNVKYVDIEGALISQDVVQLAPEPLATKRNILPLFIQDKILYLAMENPMDVDAIQRIEFRTGMQVKPLIAPPTQIKENIHKHYNMDTYIGTMLDNVMEEDSVRVDDSAEKSEEQVDLSEVRKMSEGSHVVKLVNLIISEGIKKRASDIHIESSAKQMNVRYRIDGMLTKGIKIPKWLQQPLVSRIKVISGMDIAERRRPQDGGVRVRHAGRKIDLRVSTLLTNFGEKVVIRILDSHTSFRDLTRLGLASKALDLYYHALQQPQGWILVTGPTGSGKTTTLYASLHVIKDATKNIVTIEDPIEYQLEGINQVQVNPKAGITFANGLRSILRQDPNVILVGEIRDQETAEIAMQAAETGHLMLSTLHTNDAVSTVNRLYNLGITPDLLASNLLIIVAQRLVRTICPQCKQEYQPDIEELRRLGLHNGNFPNASYSRGQGCKACNQSGYYGQTAIYELFAPTDRLRDAIAQRLSKHRLAQLARETGMQLMVDAGIEKIHQGVTTIEEVARVCQVDAVGFGTGKPCESCGKDILETDTICPFCQAPQEPSEQRESVCRHCGAAVEQQWRICPFCGTPLTEKAEKCYPPVKPASVPIRQAIEKSSVRIVIAEDEPNVRKMVKLLLEQHAYQVITAVDGEDALEKIRAEQPDLVILDVVMPKRDGFSVCKAVRSSMETMFIPVIMLTGQDSVEEKLLGLSSGADDYITKPFNADELLARIDTVLRRSYQYDETGPELRN